MWNLYFVSVSESYVYAFMSLGVRILQYLVMRFRIFRYPVTRFRILRNRVTQGSIGKGFRHPERYHIHVELCLEHCMHWFYVKYLILDYVDYVNDVNYVNYVYSYGVCYFSDGDEVWTICTWLCKPMWI